MFAVMYVRRLFSIVFAINERRGIYMYEMPLSISLLGFGMGTMLANFHMCGIMLVLRAVFNMRVQEGICVIRCLMFNLSVVIFTLFYCLLDLSCYE